MAEDNKILDASQLSPEGAPTYGGYTLEEIQAGLPEHDTLGERAKDVAEGVLQGAAGPLGTMAAIGYGSDPQAMRERAAAFPIQHKIAEAAGFLGSFGAGAGLGPLVSEAGKAVEAASGLGRIGGASARLATEMGLLSAGDEASKMIERDPDQSLGSAVTNVGLSTLLGLGGGAALGAGGTALNKLAGNKVNQFLEDFKGRINYHVNNPNPAEVLHNELEQHYQNVKSMADEVYGAEGLKAQDIAKAVPKMNEKIISQVGSIESKVSDALETMRAKPELYPAHLVGQLEDWANIYRQGVEGQFKDSADYFNSIQELKQRLQSVAKYGKRVASIAPEARFVSDARELADTLKTSLEDTDVWGNAAKRQAHINKAFTEFLPALKDFEKRFTTEMAGERVVDPGKVNTYVQQLGKPQAEIKKEMLESFLDQADKYKDTVDKSHANLGLEAPQWSSPISMARASLEDLPAGAQMADALVKRGLAKFGGRALGATIGAGAGRLAGMSGIGAIVGEHTLGPLLESILPALTKPILENPSNAEGLQGAIGYAMNVVKGERVLSKAVQSLMEVGGSSLPEHLIPTEKSLQRLDEGLKAAQNDPKAFMQSGSKVAHYLPDHTVETFSTASRATQLLNGARPNTQPQFPLDDDRKPSQIEDAKYRRMLEIAEQPAMVLNRIKDGSLTMGDVAVLQAIHPGAYANMRNKLVEAITNHAAKGGIIPYSSQMSMSMFLGQPLTASLQPGNIAVNQSVGKGRQQQQEQAPGAEGARNAPKGQKTALQKLSGMYNTPIQAREKEKLNG